MNASVTRQYGFQTGALGHNLRLFYNAQSGRPYSLLFGTDINGDGFSTNDLLFIPANGVIIQRNSGSTWTADPQQQWINYLEAAGIEAGTGEILQRYHSREPWTRKLDLHYELGVPVFRDVRTYITGDVLNLLNLFDSDAGVVRYVPNQNFSPITYRGLDQNTGLPIYRERAADTSRRGESVLDRRRCVAVAGSPRRPRQLLISFCQS